MNQKRIIQWTNRILETPLWIWILIGFSIVFYLYFINPVFHNTKHVMQFFSYINIKDPIGHDLNLTTKFSAAWFLDHRSPYIGLNLYPPLTMVLYVPFVFLKAEQAFKLMTLINLICFIGLALILPLRLNRKQSTLILLFFITGVISYGFQFELERGQYTVVTVLICMASIYIFHYYPRLHWLAYILFSISVQLKVFPAIFVVFLIDNWRDWKAIIKRMLGLAALNIAALFVLGPAIAFDFFKGITDPALTIFNWTGNHSINSFIASNLPDLYNKLHFGPWLPEYNPIAAIILFALVAICLLTGLWLVYRRNRVGFNPYLLLICTLASLLIPSISHDYKLSILPGVMAVFASTIHFEGGMIRKGISILLVILTSAAYATTLFSMTNKPLLLQNNLPALMAMLIFVALLFVIQRETNEN